jgi:hypothetical protein
MMKNTVSGQGMEAAPSTGRDLREVEVMLGDIVNDIEALKVSFATTEDLTSSVCAAPTPKQENTKCSKQVKCAMGDRLQTIRSYLIALRERIDDLNSRIEL